MLLMKVLEKRWIKLGILVFIYLDEILIVSKNFQSAERNVQIMLKDLEEAGLLVNLEKSTLVPTQQVQHLGFSINFQTGTLEVPPQKLKTIRKELGKLVTQQSMTPRKMAAILGHVRSFLTAIPYLRAFTDLMVRFVAKETQVG